MPTLWKILDSHLNTGDYHDGFDCYISIYTDDAHTFVVSFTSADETTITEWTLTKSTDAK